MSAGTCKRCGEWLWHRDIRLHQCSVVMNPPASAAQGAEARNHNMGPRHRTGAVLRGAEARLADVASVPPPFEGTADDLERARRLNDMRQRTL